LNVRTDLDGWRRALDTYPIGGCTGTRSPVENAKTMRTLTSPLNPPQTVRNRRGSAQWLALGAACLLVPGANASVLFQDGFDYTAATTLAGNGSWVNSASLITINAANLSYPGFQEVTPGANEIRILGQSASAQQYTYSPFSSSPTSGTVYASFLMSMSVVGGNYTFLGMLPSAGNGGTFNNSNDPIDLSSTSATGGYRLGIRTLGTGATYPTTTPILAVNTANLIVVKYDFAGHTASLFVNPGLDGNEPGATISSTGTLSSADIGQFYVRIGGANQGNYFIDDVRVGTTWGDVVPAAIPEPSTFVLVTVGLLGLASWRRRDWLRL
jgi:hypothetical protein